MTTTDHHWWWKSQQWRIFVAIWRHQWSFVLAAQSNNQSLHYPPSTQMPIKCCDNQFIKAEKSRSAKFKRKRLKKGGSLHKCQFCLYTSKDVLLVIGNFFSRSADGSRLNAGHNMSPTNRERPTHNTNRERHNAQHQREGNLSGIILTAFTSRLILNLIFWNFVCSSICFLAVQNSSIGDLVTNSLSH